MEHLSAVLVLALPDRRLHQDDQTPSFSIQIPHLLSLLATDSLDGQVQGMNELQQQEERAYGRGNYTPPVRTTYWSMRVMAYLGTLVFLVAVVGAFLYRRRRLETTRWFLWTGVVGDRVPVPLGAGGLGALRGRAPAVDRVGAAQDRGRELAERRRLDDRRQPRGVRLALRHARRSSTSCSCGATRASTRPRLGGEGDEFALPAVTY